MSAKIQCTACGSLADLALSVCPVCGARLNTEDHGTSYMQSIDGEPKISADLEDGFEINASSQTEADPTVSDITSSGILQAVSWSPWKTLRNLIFGLGFPALLFYASFEMSSWLFFGIGVFCTFVWPGPMIFPFVLYHPPVVVTDRGFVLCQIPFRWSDVKEFWIAENSRDWSSVAFAYSPTCKQRLNRIPYPKRHMLLLSLPIVGNLWGRDELSFPSNLDLSAKELLELLHTHAH